ncbi:hypothetical protein P8452_22390 [Trifolium repens]|jgi:hypothetical protein|nr:hypothetical protein P8452_22390 [Trifolium repens]
MKKPLLNAMTDNKTQNAILKSDDVLVAAQGFMEELNDNYNNNNDARRGNEKRISCIDVDQLMEDQIRRRSLSFLDNKVKKYQSLTNIYKLAILINPKS